MRSDFDHFRIVKKGTIESIDYLAGRPDMLDALRVQLEATEGMGYYATGECRTHECGYPRVWFGKCMAQYRDAVALKRLREIFS